MRPDVFAHRLEQSPAARKCPAGRLLRERDFPARRRAVRATRRAVASPLAVATSASAHSPSIPAATGSSGPTAAYTSGVISLASSRPIHDNAAARNGAYRPLLRFRRGSRHRTTSDANANLCSGRTAATIPSPPSSTCNVVSSSFIVATSATRHSRSAFSGVRCGMRHCPRHFRDRRARSGSSALTCRSREARTASPTPFSSPRTCRPPVRASFISLSHSRSPARHAFPARRVPSGLGESNAKNKRARGAGCRDAALFDAVAARINRPTRVHRSVPDSFGNASAETRLASASAGEVSASLARRLSPPSFHFLRSAPAETAAAAASCASTHSRCVSVSSRKSASHAESRSLGGERADVFDHLGQSVAKRHGNRPTSRHRRRPPRLDAVALSTMRVIDAIATWDFFAYSITRRATSTRRG